VTARRPKRHVIVIPAYKEPIPVLTRTLDSLEYQTYGSQRITILMAMEGADATADATFDELQTAFSGKFAQMIKTVHFIQPGELAGKSANENFAVRELHKQWAELDPSLDPYDVLVTITDADSVFSPRYIEQLDWVYSQQPAPHLLMYHPVFDTRRNFFEAHPIIAKHEANRCTSLLLLTHKHGGLGKVAMSNYSLSLGFARDIEYWTADNMPEDCHTTLKAFVYSHGADVLVPVYAVISNDLVPGFSDRYVQAKRHAYALGRDRDRLRHRPLPSSALPHVARTAHRAHPGRALDRAALLDAADARHMALPLAHHVDDPLVPHCLVRLRGARELARADGHRNHGVDRAATAARPSRRASL